jgi:hypothetical protein
MEINFSKRNILRVSVSISIIIGISFLFLHLMKHLRHENVKHREYGLYGLSNLRYVDSDAAFEPIYYHLERNDYFIESEKRMESIAILEVRKMFPHLKQYMEKKRFNNLYSLMGYLLSKGQYKYEKELFRYLLTDYKDFTFKYDHKSMIYYLNRYYLRPAKELIDKKKFFRAKWMITEALSRLNLVDTKPLDQTPFTFIDYQNRLLLLRAFLDNPEENIRDLHNSNQIYSIINHNYKLINHEVLDTVSINKTSDFKAFYIYLKGVEELSRKKNAVTAFDMFKKVDKQNESNDFLRQLNLHLFARCIFWNCDYNNYENKEKSIAQLYKIKMSLTSSNLQSDIDYYIKYLNNPQPKGKINITNNEESLILNLSL